MRLFAIAICFILSGIHAAAADRIYKTQDEYGRPVFSDEAGDGAQEVEVDDPATFSGKEYTRPYQTYSPEEEGKTGKQASYDTLAITSPANDETIRSNPGDFEVRFSVSPTLQSGHRLQLLIDGKVYRTIKGAGPVQLTNVDRGTHNLRLQVVDGEGKVLSQGRPVTMHLLRHSIRHPQGRKATTN